MFIILIIIVCCPWENKSCPTHNLSFSIKQYSQLNICNKKSFLEDYWIIFVQLISCCMIVYLHVYMYYNLKILLVLAQQMGMRDLKFSYSKFKVLFGISVQACFSLTLYYEVDSPEVFMPSLPWWRGSTRCVQHY